MSGTAINFSEPSLTVYKSGSLLCIHVWIGYTQNVRLLCSLPTERWLEQQKEREVCNCVDAFSVRLGPPLQSLCLIHETLGVSNFTSKSFGRRPAGKYGYTAWCQQWRQFRRTRLRIRHKTWSYETAICLQSTYIRYSWYCTQLLTTQNTTAGAKIMV